MSSSKAIFIALLIIAISYIQTAVQLSAVDFCLETCARYRKIVGNNLNILLWPKFCLESRNAFMRNDNNLLSLSEMIIEENNELDLLQICIENCVQCKKMFGNQFEGPICALSCMKSNGTAIPDCEDINSIAPFLNYENLNHAKPQ